MEPTTNPLPSTAFTTFFHQLALAGVHNPDVLLTKGTRRQLVEGQIMSIPTYNITYAGLNGTAGNSLTIGELIIGDEAAFYLYIDDEYELEPDGLASAEQYEYALNAFQASYSSNLTFFMQQISEAKLAYENKFPQFKL